MFFMKFMEKKKR